MSATTELQFTSPAAVCKRVGATRCTLERWVKAKQFPAPLRIGGKSLFDIAEVDAFIAQCKAKRDAVRAAK